MNNEQKKAIKLLPLLLNLTRKPVGIKFLKTQEEYEKDSAREMIKELPYCVAIQSATKGHEIKLNVETSGCVGSSRALGIKRADENYYSGCNGYKLGLYKDIEIAKKVANDLKIIKEKNYGVSIRPLENWISSPDNVIIIGESYAIMRIIQGYTYQYGIQPRFNMSGNQGICVELTTYPFLTRSLNASFLCSGTRYNSKWAENESGVGMPFSIFSEVVNGIYKTVNATEPNEKKKIIIERMAENEFDTSEIELGTAYYL